MQISQRQILRFRVRGRVLRDRLEYWRCESASERMGREREEVIDEERVRTPF